MESAAAPARSRAGAAAATPPFVLDVISIFSSELEAAAALDAIFPGLNTEQRPNAHERSEVAAQCAEL